MIEHKCAGDTDPYWRSVAAAQAKIEWPAIIRKSGKVILRICKFVGEHEVKAALFGHRFEIDTQNLRHAPVTEDSFSFRIHDPYTRGYRLDYSAIDVVTKVHIKFADWK